MTRLLGLVLAGLLLGGCGFNPNSTPMHVEVPTAARVDMDSSRVVPLVEASVNGAGPYLFLVDTGASVTIVDPSVAQSAALPTRNTVAQLSADAGTIRVQAQQAHIDALEVGGARFGGFDVLVYPLGDLAGLMERPVVGIIGMPVIAMCTWTIDYANSEIEVSTTALPQPDGREVHRFMYDGSMPTVMVVAGHLKMAAGIDTGDTDALELSPEDVERLGSLTTPQGYSRSHTITGETVELDVLVEVPVRLGKMTLERPIASVSPGTRLGSGAFEGQVLTIDGRANLIRVSPAR